MVNDIRLNSALLPVHIVELIFYMAKPIIYTNNKS